MSYDRVAKELSRKLEWPVFAYDNLPRHGGCVLFLDAPVTRINIEIAALERGAAELAAFIKEAINSAGSTVEALQVGLRDGELALV